jgi:hypothetical protein
MSLATNPDCQVLPVRVASADMESKIEKFPATILKSRLTNPEENLKNTPKKYSDGLASEEIGEG